MPDSSKMNPESENAAFTGKDGLTCHQFLRTIRQRAMDIGKQRDDQWMTDYASICLDGEALEWYESLDDVIRGDWKLLRQALLSRYTNPAVDKPKHLGDVPKKLPTFTGKDKDDCRSFVQSIRLLACGEGKEDDSAWIVRLAYPCFSGKALDWHASLPADVQRDWRRLERAILLDFPTQPTPAMSPARIHVEDWYRKVQPSSSLQELRSREDWLAQARERRRMYREANDKLIPCWLLVESERDIPDNAVRTGPMLAGGADYSARAWREPFGLVVGKCQRNIPGAHLPLSDMEMKDIRPFEVLVGDPCHFQWIAVPPKSNERSIVHRPFEAVEAGIDQPNGRASFIYQGFHNGNWHPGKVHSGDSVAFLSWGGHEVRQDSVRVLAWVD